MIICVVRIRVCVSNSVSIVHKLILQLVYEMLKSIYRYVARKTPVHLLCMVNNWDDSEIRAETTIFGVAHTVFHFDLQALIHELDMGTRSHAHTQIVLSPHSANAFHTPRKCVFVRSAAHFCAAATVLKEQNLLNVVSVYVGIGVAHSLHVLTSFRRVRGRAVASGWDL